MKEAAQVPKDLRGFCEIGQICGAKARKTYMAENLAKFVGPFHPFSVLFAPENLHSKEIVPEMYG